MEKFLTFWTFVFVLVTMAVSQSSHSMEMSEVCTGLSPGGTAVGSGANNGQMLGLFYPPYPSGWAAASVCYNHPPNGSGQYPRAHSKVGTACEPPLVAGANGVCEEPPPVNPCTDSAGQTASSGMYDLGPDGNATPPTTVCDGSCELAYNGSGVVARQLVGGEFHYFSQGSYIRTATECSGTTAPAASSSLPPPSCDPATQDQGTVNGKFVCLNRSNTETKTTPPPVTNPDGSTTETTTTTDSSTGMTTTTATTTATDGTVTSTTTSAPGTSDPFCVANPTHESCTKDDIPWGTIPGAELIPVHEVAVDTQYDVIGGEGVCPADANVSFMGQALTWSYAPLCTFADMIRPLVIALAWLSFGFIIVGGLGRAK